MGAGQGVYQQALTIKKEYNDYFGQASTYHELGRVAEEQQHWDQAEQYYQQALAIWICFSNQPGQAAASTTGHGRPLEGHNQLEQADAVIGRH